MQVTVDKGDNLDAGDLIVFIDVSNTKSNGGQRNNSDPLATMSMDGHEEAVALEAAESSNRPNGATDLTEVQKTTVAVNQS